MTLHGLYEAGGGPRQIIDRQNEITKAMVVQLGQRDALRYEEEMAAVRRDYDTAMGEVDPCKN